MDIPDVLWCVCVCVCVGCASLSVGICVASSDLFYFYFFSITPETLCSKVASLCLRRKMLHKWCIISSPNFMKAVSKWGIFLAIGLKIAPREVKMPPQCLVFICLSFLSVNVFMEIVMFFFPSPEGVWGPRRSYKNTGRGLGHSVYFILTVTYFVICFFLLSWERKWVTDVRLVSQHVTFCGEVALESFFYFIFGVNSSEVLMKTNICIHCILFLI